MCSDASTVKDDSSVVKSAETSNFVSDIVVIGKYYETKSSGLLFQRPLNQSTIKQKNVKALNI